MTQNGKNITNISDNFDYVTNNADIDLNIDLGESAFEDDKQAADTLEYELQIEEHENRTSILLV